MGFFSNDEKVTSKNAYDKAKSELQDKKSIIKTGSNEENDYGRRYMADLYVNIKDDDNVSLMFKLPEHKEMDKFCSYYNEGGNVLPPKTANIVGQKSMDFFNTHSATTLSFQKTGFMKGVVKEPYDGEIGNTVYRCRLTCDQLAAAFTYINAKRSHSYTHGYTSSTFAAHTLQASNLDAYNVQGVKKMKFGGTAKSMQKELAHQAMYGLNGDWSQMAIKANEGGSTVKYSARSEATEGRQVEKIDPTKEIASSKWKYAGMRTTPVEQHDNEKYGHVNGETAKQYFKMDNLYGDLSKVDYKELRATSGREHSHAPQLPKVDNAVEVINNLMLEYSKAFEVYDFADKELSRCRKMFTFDANACDTVTEKSMSDRLHKNLEDSTKAMIAAEKERDSKVPKLSGTMRHLVSTVNSLMKPQKNGTVKVGEKEYGCTSLNITFNELFKVLRYIAGAYDGPDFEGLDYAKSTAQQVLTSCFNVSDAKADIERERAEDICDRVKEAFAEPDIVLGLAEKKSNPGLYLEDTIKNVRQLCMDENGKIHDCLNAKILNDYPIHFIEYFVNNQDRMHPSPQMQATFDKDMYDLKLYLNKLKQHIS